MACIAESDSKSGMFLGIGKFGLMKSIRSRIVFDLLLTFILLFEVLHQLTGNTLHEIVGAAFFTCIIIHLTFASRWLKDVLAKLKTKTLVKRQKQLGVIVILLFLDFVALIISSVMISELLWKLGVDLTSLNHDKIWYPVHTVAAYALCILVIGHLSMHWTTVASALSIRYDPSRREAISQVINGFVMIGGIALGIAGIARAGFQASDFAINANAEANAKTVEGGYREVNAQTGDYVSSDAFKAESLSDRDSAAEEETAAQNDDPTCPICPRQCKLSSPRCNRPIEAGLI